jgi:SNF2 family DNA or RNA helicase
VKPNDPPALFPHQQELLDGTWEMPAYAYFYQTGCGKTAPAIHTAARLFVERRIDGVIVIAPNMVHRNWISDEIPKHSPIAWQGLDWHSSRAKLQDRALAQLLATPRNTDLAWLAITYDGVMTPRGRQAVLDFIQKFPRTMLVIDEASRIKNPESKRTKKVAALRKLSSFVRLLNGTPTEIPLDLYAQMKILDDKFWIRHGIGSWTAFKAQFCIMRDIVIGGEDDREGREPSQKWGPIVPHDATPDGVAAYEQLDLSEILEPKEPEEPEVEPVVSKQVLAEATAIITAGRTIKIPVGYRELDKLHAMIQPLSKRLTKEQAGLNLPPKLYQKLVFEMSPEQRSVYERMRREYMVELDNGVLVTAPMAMVRITRLQQIACGYLPHPEDPEAPPILLSKDKNPRLEAFLDWMEDIGNQQVIVWCRFTHDVDIICRELGPARCVRFDGEVNERDKALALELFKSGRRQACVAKASSMGMGLTIVNSYLAFYYSNTFSMIDRIQSEDRQHRPGQHHAVTYVDLVADRTVDGKILRRLLSKKETADQVIGDEYREWLTP